MSIFKTKQSRATAPVFRQFVSFVIAVVFFTQHLLILSPLTVKAAISTSIVISQFKVAGATAADEFVELHNVGSSSIDINGYRLVYRSATGTTDVALTNWTSGTIIPAGGYYLIAATPGYSQTALAAADRTFADGGSGKLAAAGGGLAIRNGAADTGVIIDSVGFGTATNAFVETAVTTAPASNSSKARGSAGCADSDNNSTDFVLITSAAPRNSATAAALCSGTPMQTNPIGSGSANPTSVLPNGNTTLTVTVTPGTTPASNGITVTADLTAIGGSAIQAFSGSGNTFTFRATVAAATASGVKSLPFTVADAEMRSTTGSISLTVNSAGNVADHVVISQVYGSGGNSGAAYRNDYVELYNPTASTVNLTGWTLQYASATSSGWDSNKQTLGGSIGAGEYYLVGLGTSNSTIGQPIPTANISGELNLSSTAGKVALVGNSDSLAGNCPLSDTDVIDFVGYGATADCSEGDVDAPAPSSTNAVFRKSNGSQDTNVNGSDFVAQAAAPRRTTPFFEVGPSVSVIDPRNSFTNAPRDSSLTITFSEPIFVDLQWFSVSCAVTGAHNDATVASYNAGKNYVITPNVNFQAGETCTVTLNKDSVHDQDTDDSAPNTDTLTANYSWSFTIATGTAPAYTPDVHLTMGNPTDATANVGEPNNFLMQKPELALSYNRDRGTPNWVSWHLDDTWVGSLTRVDTFRPDPMVPSDWYRVLATDYFGSGFDRGHMVPNADRDKETSSPINQATFLMSNILPQAPDNNQGPWAAMENDLRNNFIPANELYIISGGSGIGGTGSNGGISTTIAGGKVTVPAYTWKVALIIPKADGDDIARVNASTRTLAVIMPNTQGIRADNWRNYLTTVDQVEQLTGYDFYENLPDAVENSVEAGIDGVNPPGTASQTVNVAEDSSVSITLNAAGSGSLTYETVSSPANGSLDAATGATRIYTPNPNANGTDSFTFRVKQGAQNSNVSMISINITEVNDAPIAAADAKTTQRNANLTFAGSDLTANDNAGAANESGQTLSVTQVTSTAQTNGTVSLSGGQITYTPSANYSGPASFDYQVCDNGTTNGAADVKCGTGTVNVTVVGVGAAGIEGDVASRPNGDGLIQSDDAVQVQRFSIGLDQPYQSNEFQRADSAPFATLGDGAIQSADVIQAQRFQIGLDLQQNAAGPSALSGGQPAPFADFAAKTLENNLSTAVAPRGVRVESVTANAGQTVVVSILADAVGDESAYGFQMNFDQTKLTFVSQAVEIGGSSRLCNTTVAGQITCSVNNFPNDRAGSGTDQIGEIAAGSNQLLLKVMFTVAAISAPGAIPVTITNVNASSDAAQALTPITVIPGAVRVAAASGKIGGRILTANGRGISKAQVTLTNQNGQTKTATTNSFGYYRFADVSSGETYIISVRHKGYNFTPQVINFGESIGELLIVAEQ